MNAEKERGGGLFVSCSHEKNGGHPWLRMWGFNSIGPFFQSVSARLESVGAAEMRAGAETVGGTKRNKGDEKE